MNKIKINCFLFQNSLNKNRDQTEVKTFYLDSFDFNYKELVKQIRNAFRDSLNFDHIITYWENNEHELVIFNNDDSMMNAIKSNDLAFPFNVYIEKHPLDSYILDNFFI